MPERKFAVMHDASGETKDCTLAEFQDLQAQGFRIVDTAGYDAAMVAADDDGTAGETAMAEQGAADASAVAAAQYPEAKPAAVDKPKAAKKD